MPCPPFHAFTHKKSQNSNPASCLHFLLFSLNINRLPPFLIKKPGIVLAYVTGINVPPPSCFLRLSTLAVSSCHVFHSLADNPDTASTSRSARTNSSRHIFNRKYTKPANSHTMYKNIFIMIKNTFPVFLKITPAIVLLLPVSSPSTG